MVEAVRIGTIFARDAKQYGKWRSRKANAQPKRGGLTGAALEAAVMRIAEMFPDNVARATRG